MSIGHFQICDCFPAPSLYSSITFPSLEHLQLFLNCFDMFRVLWGLSHICSILSHPVRMFPQSSFDLEILWRLVHHLRPCILLHLDSAFDIMTLISFESETYLNRTECQPSMKQYLLSWLTCLKKASNYQVGLDSNLQECWMNEMIQIHKIEHLWTLACSFLWAAQPCRPTAQSFERSIHQKHLPPVFGGFRCVLVSVKLCAVWACIRALDTARDAAATRCIRDPAQAVLSQWMDPKKASSLWCKPHHFRCTSVSCWPFVSEDLAALRS